MEQALECLEQMDFEFRGVAEDLVKAVVPASVKADGLDLQDVIKVCRLRPCVGQELCVPYWPFTRLDAARVCRRMS